LYPQAHTIMLASLQVATALLVAGSTLTFPIPPFASTSSSQASFKARGCSYNCRGLTDGSFQLTHMARDDTLFNICNSIDRAYIAMAAKTKTKRYYSAHNVATKVSFDT